ncbi:corrinoid methyltransferase [Clostridia bacterium]|nr:corrinoid methyltransferase [Clostridia bacterium]
MSIEHEISEFLQKGRMPKVKELVNQALEQGVSAKSILENGLIHGMGIIGEKFKNGDVFVPEVMVAARAMNAGVEILKPALIEAGVKPIGRAIIGTVEGDLHDIGKNLVKLMMEGKGIEVIDLGVNVAPAKFVSAVREYMPSVVCCSALLTTTMGKMREVVELLAAEGLRGSVKVMVGGAPITQEFCESIGADYYTPDAGSAADRAVQCIQ